jgi:hypothetical protein
MTLITNTIINSSSSFIAVQLSRASATNRLSGIMSKSNRVQQPAALEMQNFQIYDLDKAWITYIAAFPDPNLMLLVCEVQGLKATSVHPDSPPDYNL